MGKAHRETEVCMEKERAALWVKLLRSAARTPSIGPMWRHTAGYRWCCRLSRLWRKVDCLLFNLALGYTDGSLNPYDMGMGWA